MPENKIELLQRLRRGRRDCSEVVILASVREAVGGVWLCCKGHLAALESLHAAQMFLFLSVWFWENEKRFDA